MNIKRRKYTILISIIASLFLLSFLKTSFLFNNVLINISNFSTLDNKVYFSPLITQDKKDSITELVNKAIQRNNSFWGRTEPEYQIIFCGSNDELKKYANGISTATFCSFIGNYTVIGQNWANLDIISHELCHSYLYDEIGFMKMSKLPTWFDEGIAMQVDYRTYYCDSIIERNYKTDMSVLNGIASKRAFFVSDKNTVRKNYIVAKIEIENWISKNGKNNFIQLINSLVDGGEFFELYK